jgi:hypothetical protein
VAFGKVMPATVAKPWESVSLDLPREAKPGHLQAIVRARDAAGRPLPGRHVSFTRGEHLGCIAQTDGRGVARCTLWDAHGHSPDEHEPEATVAAFGGAVLADRILLPTAKVFRPSPTAHHRRRTQP